MRGNVPTGSVHGVAKARLDRDGALGIITLDNPPLNTIGDELIADLLAALTQIEASPGLRALLIRGEGKVFSAGADVNVFAGRGPDELRPLIASFLDLGRRIEHLPFPTLAALHGTSQAGGFELALFCDLLWAADGTQLGLPETRLGIVPLAGGIERVSARAGLGRARTVALGGTLFPAEQLYDWGVVDRVLAGEELHAAAEKFAKLLAQGPTRAFAVVKELARAYTQGGVPRADGLLLEAAVGLFDTDDARNGIESFLASGSSTASFVGH
jgi:enoyl-CoA hydratase/carnithine racemase